MGTSQEEEGRIKPKAQKGGQRHDEEREEKEGEEKEEGEEGEEAEKREEETKDEKEIPEADSRIAGNTGCRSVYGLRWSCRRASFCRHQFEAVRRGVFV